MISASSNDFRPRNIGAGTNFTVDEVVPESEVSRKTLEISSADGILQPPDSKSEHNTANESLSLMTYCQWDGDEW